MGVGEVHALTLTGIILMVSEKADQTGAGRGRNLVEVKRLSSTSEGSGRGRKMRGWSSGI